MGTPAAYWRSHLDLLESSPDLRLDDSLWPLLVAGEPPTLTARHARSTHEWEAATSLVADDCVVDGTLSRSVLFSGARIGEHAFVESSVILPGAVIGRGCRLRGVIVDSDCRVPDGTAIERPEWGALDEPEEPIVITAEDLSAGLVSSCA